ncbi:hypothetical protein B0H12DRAFT_1031132 [Mycena haematopus]|nr:hypothetical protein B0H12DRAFT_1031132 [Mycena haematopus]
MFPLLSSTILAFFWVTTSAAVLPRAGGVTLAVSPQCGTLSGGVPVDVNVGLGPLSSYKTIVTFGDSYTGGPTNGATWVQDLAGSTGAKLINYAVKSSAGTFIGSEQGLDPSTTLFIIFFGIGDEINTDRIFSNGRDRPVTNCWCSCNEYFGKENDRSNERWIGIVDNYGLGKTSPAGDAFKGDLFTSLGTGHRLYGWNVGFASFNSIWEGVLYGPPGAAAFGYTDTGVCVQGGETCADPAHTLYWTAGSPSAATHAIMATYVEQVLTQCKSST